LVPGWTAPLAPRACARAPPARALLALSLRAWPLGRCAPERSFARAPRAPGREPPPSAPRARTPPALLLSLPLCAATDALLADAPPALSAMPPECFALPAQAPSASATSAGSVAVNRRASSLRTDRQGNAGPGPAGRVAGGALRAERNRPPLPEARRSLTRLHSNARLAHALRRSTRVSRLAAPQARRAIDTAPRPSLPSRPRQHSEAPG
jgi:hypothetical protein